MAEKHRIHYRTDRGRALANRYNKSVTGRWNIIRANAKRDSKVSFDVTKVQFLAVQEYPCTYCGGDLPEMGSGLDRLEAGGAYRPGNVAPCCDECNVARSNHFSPEEMLAELGPAIARIRMVRGDRLRPAIPLAFWGTWDGNVEALPGRTK
jgi:hypothetical protein